MRDLVPALPARRRIEQLRAQKWTYARISRESGVGLYTVRGIAIGCGHGFGAWQHVTRDASDRILALEVPPENDITAIPLPPEEWQEQAACRSHDPELWWSPLAKDQRDAQEICVLDCPVRRECGLTALAKDERFGIWAGHDMSNARDMRSLASALGVPAPHRPRTRKAKMLTRQCVDCGAEFQVRSDRDRDQCRPCNAGLMPAAQVREFIVELIAQGRTHQQIAEMAGEPVTKYWVTNMAAGRYQRTSVEYAERLFAISSVAVAS
ncbi:WhiB family transcriptional regulator [Nocardia fusca]|uniref:Transcriptional regulator WhiB n=1 Tax=Nocardia fusca TaxID=941183 RepID=A0ABV3FIM4_9NOCA